VLMTYCVARWFNYWWIRRPVTSSRCAYWKGKNSSRGGTIASWFSKRSENDADENAPTWPRSREWPARTCVIQSSGCIASSITHLRASSWPDQRTCKLIVCQLAHSTRCSLMQSITLTLIQCVTVSSLLK